MQLPLLRTIDIFLALTGIIVGLPILVTIFTLGLFDTGSPLFFQQRVGKNQALFTLIKFRTMSPSTSSVASHLANASSITKLGRVLRKTKLDELPQLFNVLFGQMSLVGPRPCLLNQTELIAEREKRNIFKVRPGITGLAQTCKVDMSTPRKLARYDQLMIKKINIKFYLLLIITTLMGKGRGDRIKLI